MTEFQHQAVLEAEAVRNLITQEGGIYIDATYGRGGHSKSILEAINENGQLIAIDRDADAVEDAKRRFAYDKRFSIYHAPFSEIAEITSALNLTGKINGVLFDLGVSSPQFDNPERGFSFSKDGMLDMRMDRRQKLSARDWINHATESELSTVFKEFGEEKFARRIARAIVNTRRTQPIYTTAQLASIVSEAHPSWEIGHHPATKTFQAIRIFINQELEELDSALNGALDALSIGGRLAVISFHSLEDRIVKRFIRKQSIGDPLPKEIPLAHAPGFVPRLKKVGGIIKPSYSETHANPRSRSAVMRIAEKLQ